jgi:DNA polymerase elongation subunit (family B)
LKKDKKRKMFQPCSWNEHDHNFQYVVDTYGRTGEGDIARVRLTGFKPYFYLRAGSESASEVQSALKSSKGTPIQVKITKEKKLDAMAGFSDLKPIDVWKLEFSALWAFKHIARECKNDLRIGSRLVTDGDLFESNLPPYLRLFHERGLNPASAFSFEGTEQHDDIRVDKCFVASYKTLNPVEQQIPLYILSYDLEVYSESGQFPVAENKTDEIIQIGLSTRWTDDLMTPVERIVLISGTCVPSETVKYVSCKNERDLLLKFQEMLYHENPDILVGYNTFGFDDGYLAERASLLGISLCLGRSEPWKQDNLPTVRKTFELASGKYAVRYLDLGGRLTIDLLLSIRREQNLDSYKLDNVASTFLRDKVTEFVIITGASTRKYEIHTKSTRGLFAGNFVRFDIVTNTLNPYADGKKFKVSQVFPKKFIVELDEVYLNTFDDIPVEDRKKLEWSFSKDDVSAAQMFKMHRGTPAERSEIAKYCIQDCDLVLTLMAKLDTLVNARGMADVCRVPVDYIFLRGQGIKIYSAVVFYASQRNQILQTQETLEGDMSYEGAIVLPPKIGMYLDQPIPVLDFNSLYPTNMIAFNLSPDTLVYTKTYDSDGHITSQTGIKTEFPTDEISYDIPGGRKTCGFVQAGKPDLVGMLPLTLDILLKKRKETRKQMETEPDDARKSVLNGLQLAYKTVANSVYGQCGSRSSAIRKVEVAACTTALGRARIHDAKMVVESEFGATVVYGDSVTGYTPITLKIKDKIVIMSMEELGRLGEWKKCHDSDKEYVELFDIQSWTDKGWTDLERIIRHQLAPHKKIIRVLTHAGCVDVTDDHSLLKPDATEISPRDLKVGDELLHTEIPDFNTMTHDLDELRIMGFFMGDGSCGVYQCPSGMKSSWALNNADMKLLEFYKTLCEKVYPSMEWVINNTIESSGVYKLMPRCRNYGSIKKFVEKYRELLYVDKRKNIPEFVLNGSREMAKSFWDGLYDADGDKTGTTRIDQKHETTCAQIAYLATKLGYKISINTRMDKQNVYRITCCKKYSKPHQKIKKLYEIPYSGYVYDLTTENHHFQAGIGSMIVHNTDSIFVQFPTKSLPESIDLAKKAADRITSLCRKPYKIEYEKTFFPFILFCRKRYIGLMYEDDVKKCKRKFMGIALKRRDSAPVVKDVYGGCLDILLEQRSLKNAQDFLKTSLVSVLKNEVPLEKFIITKQLRDDYKNPDQIAHRVLADRMTERDPGNKPQVGDRIAYVYVAGRSGKQGDRIENVEYVREKKLKPDSEFYITNQIQNPVAQLFALGIEQITGYIPKKYPEFPELDEEEATLKVLAMKEKELDSLLFTGAQYLRKEKRGPLDAFFRK